MTTPSPADAGLRDALARANFNWDCRWLSAADLERTWIDPLWAVRRQQAFRHADALLTGPLATETRAHAEVKRERDEANRKATTAEAESAVLRAALEAAVPFLDHAGGDGLILHEVDAADVCQQVADALGIELGGHEWVARAALAASPKEGSADASR